MGWMEQRIKGPPAAQPLPSLPSGPPLIGDQPRRYSQPLDASGKPILDIFKPNGALQDRYVQDPGKYNTGSRELNALSDRAMSKGPSPWLNMQLGKNEADTRAMRDIAGRDASNASGMAMSNLAMSGGLDSGARERIATSGGLGRMNALQDVSRQGNMNKFNLGIEDERQKLSILQQLPGQRLDRASYMSGIDAGNIGRAYGAHTGQYQEGMKAWGADKTADAIAAGGSGNGGLLGGGGFMGTGVDVNNPLGSLTGTGFMTGGPRGPGTGIVNKVGSSTGWW